MKKCTLENYVLQDDKTIHGGVSYDGQTLWELAEEIGNQSFFDLIKQRKIRKINKELKYCGIEPIKRRYLL